LCKSFQLRSVHKQRCSLFCHQQQRQWHLWFLEKALPVQPHLQKLCQIDSSLPQHFKISNCSGHY
jgi:hypothetical protein